MGTVCAFVPLSSSIVGANGIDRLTGLASPDAAAQMRLDPRFPGVAIHESAYVDAPVVIGEGTKIWHFVHILRGCHIGAHCSIGQNVMIGPDVVVGDNCKIQNNVSLYAGVELEDGVFCGPSCVFTNVNNPRAEIERKTEFRKTLIKRGTTIGANATIVCGHTLGEYSFIAAAALVASDVQPFALMAGVPARRIGWMSKAGARLGSDLVCPIDGSCYKETSDGQLRVA
ncbi:N-acetyltransferase [Methylocystis sp. FS]|nr:N-acetyltransferase [Methylocystis silviterrae]